ncbi:MAG: TetR/AcrR family transcriptional regulator [Clostridia bacterium]|nr:TetR/AcrR family transcriptional regulator [Clostridia bacterium]
MTSPSKHTDRRVIKTKKAIRDAFVAMLSEKDINDITVKDIADRADINRKTFYNYYSGIYQVMDEIENELVSRYELLLGEVDLKKDLRDPRMILAKLTMIDSDMEFLRYILFADRNMTFLTKITDLLKDKTLIAFTKQIPLDPEKADVMLTYLFSGMIAAYQNWFRSGRRQSIEELSQTISVIATTGINGMINTCIE